MLVAIAAVLVVIWIASFLVFHITSGLIHLILVVAVILFVFNLIRGRSA